MQRPLFDPEQFERENQAFETAKKFIAANIGRYVSEKHFILQPTYSELTGEINPVEQWQTTKLATPIQKNEKAKIKDMILNEKKLPDGIGTLDEIASFNSYTAASDKLADYAQCNDSQTAESYLVQTKLHSANPFDDKLEQLDAQSDDATLIYYETSPTLDGLGVVQQVWHKGIFITDDHLIRNEEAYSNEKLKARLKIALLPGELLNQWFAAIRKFSRFENNIKYKQIALLNLFDKHAEETKKFLMNNIRILNILFVEFLNYIQNFPDQFQRKQMIRKYKNNLEAFKKRISEKLAIELEFTPDATVPKASVPKAPVGKKNGNEIAKNPARQKRSFTADSINNVQTNNVVSGPAHVNLLTKLEQIEDALSENKLRIENKNSVDPTDNSIFKNVVKEDGNEIVFKLYDTKIQTKKTDADVFLGMLTAYKAGTNEMPALDVDPPDVNIIKKWVDACHAVYRNAAKNIIINGNKMNDWVSRFALRQSNSSTRTKTVEQSLSEPSQSQTQPSSRKLH